MTNHQELTCQQVVELVTDYLENALLQDLRSRFEDHVATCPGCDAYLEQVRQTITMLHQLAQTPAFPTTRQQLLHRFQEWKQR